MKKVIIVVPVLFLAALVVLALMLYKKTESDTACVGEQCKELTADQLADMAIEARAR